MNHQQVIQVIIFDFRNTWAIVKSRAEIQREYRRRLRVDPVPYELYLLKARQRKHKNYVPFARLNRAEKGERRKSNAIYWHRHRQKKRERQVAENECTMNASGYESACTSTEERLIVNMKFPNRRSVRARVRISRTLTKKSKECKKLQKEINESQKNTNVLYALVKEWKRKQVIFSHLTQMSYQHQWHQQNRNLWHQEVKQSFKLQKLVCRQNKVQWLKNSCCLEYSPKSIEQY